MDHTLLTTKLYIPPPCPILVSRPRLTVTLSKALTRSLTIVSAPAGYGKTTLVSSWLYDADIPSAWLSLDEGDNDPIRFLQYLIAALQQTVPTIQPDLLSVLQGKRPAPYNALINIIINEYERCATPFVLVLDDFHVIQAQSVLEMMTYLLDHDSRRMHLMLLSRTDPPLPLSRLRVRNQLVDIRVDQLRFTQDEIAYFLAEVMGLNLSLDDIAAMETKTEGWIASLQLAAVSMQSIHDIHGFVSAFTGSHYYIMDYLTEEVLKRLPERISSFLLQTSILERMCGPLCEAVVEPNTLEQTSGYAMLGEIERMNLFLIPLDGERRWYRYHHLFVDVVNQRLKHLFPQQLQELHDRASQWYEQNAMTSEAIHHAIMAGNQARAAQLIEQNGCSLLMRGEGFTLLKWVESVAPFTHTHPWLSILKAWGLALTGHLDGVEPTLRTAEGLFSPLESTIEAKIMLGSIAAVRAYIANLHGEAQLAANYALGALAYLPVSNDFSCSMRSVATSICGDASWINGNLLEARSAYLDAIQISQAADNIYMTIIAKSNLAEVLVEQGELHQAARIFTETLQNARRPDGQELPMADRLIAGLGGISYEWNCLETADQHTRRCIELCQQWKNSNLLATSYIMLARLERLHAHPDKAQEAIQTAEQLVNDFNLTPKCSIWVKSALARFSLVQGNLENVSRFIQQSGIDVGSMNDDTEVSYLHEPIILVLARLLMAKGKYDDVLALSQRLLQKVEAEKRIGRVIEVLALQALAFQGLRNREEALVVLERALRLAQQEGYTRVFLDEGEPMVKLLFQAKAHHLGQGYASVLLSAQGLVSGIELPPAQRLIEPLTRRELEVLKLIESGCTNQVIADRLIISIPTVKRHISNIYAKLGAKSRTQAVSLAKDLGLFE